MIYEYNSERKLADGSIDCMINHPDFGWIPTTLRDSDPETSDMYEIINSDPNLSEGEPI